MYLSVSRCAAFSAHAMLAGSADEFSRKYIVEYFFLAAGGDFVFLVDGVHLGPDLLCDDGWKDVVVSRALMGDFSDIAFVVEDNIDVFVVYMFSALAADIPRFQIFGDGDGFITLCVFHKYLAHNFCLCFVYDVLLVFDNIPERRMTARCVTFEPTLPQAAVDFLFQVFREIFVRSAAERRAVNVYCVCINARVARGERVLSQHFADALYEFVVIRRRPYTLAGEGERTQRRCAAGGAVVLARVGFCDRT